MANFDPRTVHLKVAERMQKEKEDFILSVLERLGIDVESEIQQVRNLTPDQALDIALTKRGYKIELWTNTDGSETIKVWRLEEAIKIGYSINVVPEYE